MASEVIANCSTGEIKVQPDTLLATKPAAPPAAPALMVMSDALQTWITNNPNGTAVQLANAMINWAKNHTPILG